MIRWVLQIGFPSPSAGEPRFSTSIPSLRSNSATATKTYDDLKISVDPESDTNGVSEPHTFTVKVEKHDGTGWAAAQGVTPAISFNGAAPLANTCADPGTNASGECTVTINSASAGTFNLTASISLIFGQGENSATVTRSDSASKIYVAGSLAWTKVDGSFKLLGGATFEVCRKEDRFDAAVSVECFSVKDNDALDTDKANGVFSLAGLKLGKYTVKETLPPPGYVGDARVVDAYLSITSPLAYLGEWFNLARNARLTPTGTDVDGRRVVPYRARSDIENGKAPVAGKELVFVEDPVEAFFLQIQGSGRVRLTDGSVIRLGYADQNGHPYRSIGCALVERGELPLERASMQGIREWGRRNPEKLGPLLDENPSYVFFREVPAPAPGTLAAKIDGPYGSLGVPLLAERTLAVDTRSIPLGAPVFLATTWPLSTQQAYLP